MARRLSRKTRSRVRQVARDGMAGCALGLVALTALGHPGGLALVAAVLGLAGIGCARLSAALRTASRGAAGQRSRSRWVTLGTYSPECIEGGASHGECSGVGCDCTCGHLGRSRHRSRVPVRE